MIIPDAKVAVGREFNKSFEEVVVDNVANAIDYFEKMFLKENCLLLFSEVTKNSRRSRFGTENKIIAGQSYGAKIFQ